MRSLAFITAAAIGAIAAQPALADTSYRYTNAGTQAPNYVFTATGDGLLSGWYMGSTAGFDETLGLKVNGVTVASGIFANHGTPDFTRYDFGNVKAGDALEFFIDVSTTGLTFSSTAANNADGLVHTYASAHPDEPWIGVPAGTFVGFEDLLGGGDLNYNDHTFVFANVSYALPTMTPPDQMGAVPEPATWAMMLTGFGAVGVGARRRRRTMVAA